MVFFPSCLLLAQVTGVSPEDRIISYTAVNKPLKNILVDLSLKTNVNISFNERQINQYQAVTVIKRSTALGEILQEALKHTDLRYSLIEDQIVISKNDRDLTTGERLITVSGFIEDQRSSERLINANIFLPELGRGTISNEFGFFSISIPTGEQRLNFSYLGYTAYELLSEFYKDTSLVVRLEQNTQIQEVIITDKITLLEVSGDSIIETRTTSSRDLLETMSNREIESMISIGGETDVYTLTQYKSGVNAGVDGFGGLYVRGGSKDQNLVLLDGIPIYNSDHALGIFSIFNSDVIKNAKLIKSGIPAHYDGRLSSVLDIRTKEGNKQAYQMHLNFGLFTGKVAVEGPLKKDKSSFLISFRRSYVDPWINALADYIDDENNISETQYYFYDFNAKLNFQLNDKNTLFISAYRGKDAFLRNSESGSPIELQQTSENLVDWDWGNNLFVVGLNTQLTKKSYLSTSLYLNDYSFESLDLDRFKSYDNEGEFSSEEYSFGLFNSKITDLGFKLNLDYIPSTKHFIKTGFSYIDHSFEPGLLFYSTFISNDLLFPPNSPITKGLLNTQIEELSIPGSELNVYLEDEITPNSNLRINLGVLAALIRTDGKNYFRPQPRLSINNRFGKAKLFMSVAWISQYIQALTNSGLGYPADLWLPSTSQLAPQSSINSNLGLIYNGRGFDLKTELYYRQLDNVVAFNEGSIFNINQDVNNWEEQIPKGSGEAYGWEWELKKTVGKNNWFFNYTWAKSTRQFEGINNGLRFPARYDRRHSVKLAWFYQLNDKWTFTANWIYASGQRITLPTSFIEVPLPDQTVDLRLIYEEKNNFTLRSYHKLDISFDYRSQTSWGEHELRLGVTNVYNRQNPFYVDIVRDLDNPLRFSTKELTLFPIMPSISYGLHF